jgi:hypothetical protein
MTDQEVGFSDRLARPDRLKIAAVAGGALAVVLAAAATMGASPTPTASNGAGASAAPGASGHPTEPSRRGSKGGGFGFAFGDRGGFEGRSGRAITITAIDGSTISLETEDGWTRTITVTGSTTITEGGQAATVADLKVGDQIRFRQSRASDGTYTIEAIDVVVPTVVGTVTAVEASSITVRKRDGTTRTITTTASTTYRVGSAEGTHADVVVGATILAAGEAGSGNAFTATSIVVAPARVVGTVSAKAATTITIERRDGTSVTVNVDADTTYEVAGINEAGLADVAVGMWIGVSGRVSGDGSIDASRVRAANPGSGFRGGPWGDKPGRAAPAASPDASSNDG